jgi:hypothetical protein
MWDSSGAKLGTSMLAVLTVAVTACSSAAHDKTSARGATGPASDATTRSTPTTGLERFLLVRGEEPGYRPNGSVDTVTDVNEYAAHDGLTQHDARRLRDMGFDQLLSQPLAGAHGVGVTSLMLFRTAAGAKSQAAEERRHLEIDYAGWTVKRFHVPGVPDAFGWTATRLSDRVGNVRWVEGRCVLTIGNASRDTPATSFVEPLTTGAQAMHRRIAGGCP